MQSKCSDLIDTLMLKVDCKFATIDLLMEIGIFFIISSNNNLLFVVFNSTFITDLSIS